MKDIQNTKLRRSSAQPRTGSHSLHQEKAKWESASCVCCGEIEDVELCICTVPEVWIHQKQLRIITGHSITSATMLRREDAVETELWVSQHLDQRYSNASRDFDQGGLWSGQDITWGCVPKSSATPSLIRAKPEATLQWDPADPWSIFYIALSSTSFLPKKKLIDTAKLRRLASWQSHRLTHSYRQIMKGARAMSALALTLLAFAAGLATCSSIDETGSTYCLPTRSAAYFVGWCKTLKLTLKSRYRHVIPSGHG